MEIEAPTNRWLVHPLSRALVDVLIRTPATPNQVSVSSVFVAAAGAACYVGLPWPWNAPAGLVFQIAWHVLDGADGDLARRTGRASPIGELVDGICDHVSQAILYVALAIILRRALGDWAWILAFGAGLSHFVQANAYESGRKTYRRWVYGAAWMRQSQAEARGPLQRALGALYLAVSSLFSPGEARVEVAMAGDPPGARELYLRRFAPLVSASGVLGANARTVAAFLAVLAGSPLWFFLWEITALNVALAAFTVMRARRNAAIVSALDSPSSRPPKPERL